jgi:hypothetical protein
MFDRARSASCRTDVGDGRSFPAQPRRGRELGTAAPFEIRRFAVTATVAASGRAATAEPPV